MYCVHNRRVRFDRYESLGTYTKGLKKIHRSVARVGSSPLAPGRKPLGRQNASREMDEKKNYPVTYYGH